MFTHTTMVHLINMERSEKMEIVSINESNLIDRELDIINNKVRAILVKNDKVLVANYGGIMLFPGGKVDKGENLEEALVRELFEETGIKYNINEFRKLLILKYYQHNYHDRGNNVVKIKEILEWLKKGKYNPRKEYFDREIEEVIKVYKRIR